VLFDVIRHFLSLQRSQWFDKKKLSQIQAKKLASIISHAYNNVAFYRELYSSIGLNNSPRIEELPLITKEIIRAVPTEKLVSGGVITEEHQVSYTSGSSGMPLKIIKNDREAWYSDALRLRSLLAQGAKLTDKICTIRPVPIDKDFQIYRVTEKRRFYGFLKTSRVRPVPLSPDMRKHVELFKMWRPQVLSTFPSYLVRLIDFCRSSETHLTFRMIRTQGELLTEQTRKIIEEFFQTRVFDSFGAAEVGHIAWECPTRVGYHVNSEAVFMEVLRDGTPASPGEEGEIYVTTLYRYTMPFIRYNLGDIGVILNDECPCGRGLPLISRIYGRVVDIIVRRDGVPVFPLTVLYTLQEIEGLHRFRVIQRSDYVIEVYIKPRQGLEDAVATEVEKRCRLLFPNTPFIIKTTDQFQDDKIKFRPIVSYVKVS